MDLQKIVDRQTNTKALVSVLLCIFCFQLLQRSNSKNELRNRLFDNGTSKHHNQNSLTNLPSVVNTSKGRPLLGKGLQFRPQRTSSLNGIDSQNDPSRMIVLNRKQSAFLAGASKAVQDSFTNSEIDKLNQQREKMFQSIEDVQIAEDPNLEDEKNQLLFCVPSMKNLKGSMNSIPNKGKEWTQDLSTQLSRFKNSQNQKFFPQKTEQLKPDSRRHSATQQTNKLPPPHPQFQSLNMEPYIRPSTQVLNTSQSRRLIISQQMQSLPQLGLKTLTPNTSSRFLPETEIKQNLPPKATGQQSVKIQASPSQLSYNQSEILLKQNVESQTKKVKIQLHPTNASTSQLQQSERSFTQTQHIDNKNFNSNVIAQSEAAEEVLRQHYYIAKVTQRTSHKKLEKEGSPVKYFAGHQRLERLEGIQVQAAGYMRLNAVWGLESENFGYDIQKAQIEIMNEAVQGGVFTDVLPQKEFKYNVNEKITDLEMMISLFLRQPQDNGYFIYLTQGEDVNNPFDLKPMLDFIRPNDKKSKTPSGLNEEAINNQSDKYYTLSKKGITTYYKDNPEGYEQIQDWLLARGGRFLRIGEEIQYMKRGKKQRWPQRKSCLFWMRNLEQF